jgi:steroid delta-isomerase-like uncharacterized protein
VSLQPDAMMRRWFDEVWNQGRVETIYELSTPDTAIHGLPGAPMRGSDAFKGLFDAFRGAFPDLRITVVRTITQGDTVAVHCRVTGTHLGATLGLAPTNRQVDFEGVTIVRAQDGRLVEGWNFFDFLRMYQQLGAVPALPGQ